LRDWLRAEGAEGEGATTLRGLRLLALSAAAGSAAAGLALGLLVHPVALVALAASLGFGLLAHRLRPEPDGRAREARARFERLRAGQVEGPREGVEARLVEIERARADAVFADRVRQQAAARLDAMGDVSALRERVGARTREVAERVGAPLGTRNAYG